MQYFSLSLFYALKIVLSSRIWNFSTHNERRTTISRWFGPENEENVARKRSCCGWPFSPCYIQSVPISTGIKRRLLYRLRSMHNFFINIIIAVFQLTHLISKAPGLQIFKMWSTILLRKKKKILSIELKFLSSMSFKCFFYAHFQIFLV